LCLAAAGSPPGNLWAIHRSSPLNYALMGGMSNEKSLDREGPPLAPARQPELLRSPGRPYRRLSGAGGLRGRSRGAGSASP
jgi:hypothetical protein